MKKFKKAQIILKGLLNSKSERMENLNTNIDLTLQNSLNLKSNFSNLKTVDEKVKLIDTLWRSLEIEGYYIDYSPLLNYKDSLYFILEECINSKNIVLINNIILIFYAVFTVKGYDKEISEMKIKFIEIAKKHNNIQLLNEFNSLFSK